MLVAGGAYNVYCPTYTAKYYTPYERAMLPARGAHNDDTVGADASAVIARTMPPGRDHAQE